ncbi:MAG: ISAzo13-like element transposase-related protein [Solirubrobacteraceae bacterium]
MLADLDLGDPPLPAGKVRRHSGPALISEREPGLVEDLERLVDPVTRGDPESPLRWTSKSGAKLAEALRELGHDVVDRTVLRLMGNPSRIKQRPGPGRLADRGLRAGRSGA